MRAYTPSHPQLHNSSLFIRWLLSSSSRPQLFSYGSSLQPEVSLRGADWPQPKASTVKRLFDSYLWFCVCSIKKKSAALCQHAQRFFSYIGCLSAQNPQKCCHFLPQLEVLVCLPTLKMQKSVLHPSLCLILSHYFLFFPYCLSNSYFSTTTTYQKYLSALFPAGRQINKPQDEEPSSSSGTRCCSLSLRLLWYRSSQTPSLCYRSAAIIYS